MIIFIIIIICIFSLLLLSFQTSRSEKEEKGKISDLLLWSALLKVQYQKRS